MIKCEKCGAVNHHTNSSFCPDCGTHIQPDIAHEHDKKAESSQPISTQSEKSINNIQELNESSKEIPLKSNKPENELTPRNIQSNSASMPDKFFGEDNNMSVDDKLFEIKEVDFDDLSTLVFNKQDMDEPTTKSTNKLDPDDLEIETDLTLYRDDEMQITMEHTEDGPEITLSSKSDLESISKPVQPEIENQTESANEPPQLSKEDLSFNSDEDKTVTQKIIINPEVTNKIPVDKIKLSNDSAPVKSKIGSKKTNDTSAKKATELKKKSFADIEKTEPLVKSHGIAYVAGNSITFAGGFKPVSGESLIIGSKKFDLKKRQKRNRIYYAGIFGFVIITLILASFLIDPTSGGEGQIVGLLAGSDGDPEAGAHVIIRELDITVKTNHAGFFVFDNIPAGIYTIEVLEDGVGIMSENIPVIGDKTSTLSFSMSSVNLLRPEQTPGENANKSSKQETQNGFLRVVLSPSNSRVYLDGQYIGKGSQTFKVDSGKHKVTVKHDNYEQQSKNVNIPANRTESYSFTLKQLEDSEKQTKKSNKDIAAELENKGKFSDALTYYNNILSNNDDNIEALLGKARCHNAIGETEQAMSIYLKTAKIASLHKDARSKLTALSGMIGINSNHLTARYSRGIIYMNQEEYYRAAVATLLREREAT